MLDSARTFVTSCVLDYHVGPSMVKVLLVRKYDREVHCFQKCVETRRKS